MFQQPRPHWTHKWQVPPNRSRQSCGRTVKIASERWHVGIEAVSKNASLRLNDLPVRRVGCVSLIKKRNRWFFIIFLSHGYTNITCIHSQISDQSFDLTQKRNINVTEESKLQTVPLTLMSVSRPAQNRRKSQGISHWTIRDINTHASPNSKYLFVTHLDFALRRPHHNATG